VNCCRYVDDIIIIHNPEKTNTEPVLTELNNIFPSLNLTCEMEKDNPLNFIHSTIKNVSNGLLFSIFRKPSASDVIINYHSCHLPEHKNLAVKFRGIIMQNYPVR
jgi:hypothetical protein